MNALQRLLVSYLAMRHAVENNQPGGFTLQECKDWMAKIEGQYEIINNAPTFLSLAWKQANRRNW